MQFISIGLVVPGQVYLCRRPAKIVFSCITSVCKVMLRTKKDLFWISTTVKFTFSLCLAEASSLETAFLPVKKDSSPFSKYILISQGDRVQLADKTAQPVVKRVGGKMLPSRVVSHFLLCSFFLLAVYQLVIQGIQMLWLLLIQLWIGEQKWSRFP